MSTVLETATKTTIEPWVDAAKVAAHTGFEPDHIRKLANQGKIPAVQMQNGKRVYWRFKLSQVDVFMLQSSNVSR